MSFQAIRVDIACGRLGRMLRLVSEQNGFPILGGDRQGVDDFGLAGVIAVSLRRAVEEAGELFEVFKACSLSVALILRKAL